MKIKVTKKKEPLKVKVSNLTSPRSGRDVPNQFEIRVGNIRYFQSYQSTIVKIEDGGVFLDEFYWNYSRTTTKYLNQYLGQNTKEIKEGIQSGSIKLINLN